MSGRLTDVPIGLHRRGKHAGQLLTIGCWKPNRAERHVRERLQRLNLNGRRQVLSLVGVDRCSPSMPQTYQDWVRGPTRKSRLPDPSQHGIDRWIEDVPARPRGQEGAPAALVRRGFIQATLRHGCDVKYYRLNIHA